MIHEHTVDTGLLKQFKQRLTETVNCTYFVFQPSRAMGSVFEKLSDFFFNSLFVAPFVCLHASLCRATM